MHHVSLIHTHNNGVIGYLFISFYFLYFCIFKIPFTSQVESLPIFTDTELRFLKMQMIINTLHSNSLYQ